MGTSALAIEREQIGFALFVRHRGVCADQFVVCPILCGGRVGCQGERGELAGNRAYDRKREALSQGTQAGRPVGYP